MQRKQSLLIIRRIWIFNAFFMLLLGGSILLHWQGEAAVTVSSSPSRYQANGFFTWKDALDWTIPGLRSKQANSGAGPAYLLFSHMVDLFTNVDSSDLRSIFTAEMPHLAVQVSSSGHGSAVENVFPQAVIGKVVADGKPVVGIYHTHTAESFIPSTGVAHRPGGQVGEICEVGKALIDRLHQYNIQAIQDTTVHDYPSFMKAYGASEITLTRMIKENPSLQMVFDIHRDAEKRDNVITEINGKKVAKLSIIVAQGQADLPQPHWKENYALAKLIDSKCNEKYPGLSRGIQLVDWRYNQHLHNHALLLEVGSHETSTEEGINAMYLLGDVLNDLLKEGLKNQ